MWLVLLSQYLCFWKITDDWGLPFSFLSHKSKQGKSCCFPFDIETRFRRMVRCWTVAWKVGAEGWSFVSKSANRERKNVEERRNYSDSPKRTSGIFLSSRSDGGGGGGDSFWPGKNGGHVRRIFGWIFDPPPVAHRETIANLSPPTSLSLSSPFYCTSNIHDASNLLQSNQKSTCYCIKFFQKISKEFSSFFTIKLSRNDISII